MKIAYWQVNGDESLFSIFSRTLGHFDGSVSVRLYLTLYPANWVGALIREIVPTLIRARVINTENQIRTFCYHRAEYNLGDKDRIAIIIQEVE